MTPESIVIAGAGLAGATAARTLRAEGYAGNITIAGTEPHRPYLRPPLSKEYLLGKAGEDAVEVVPETGTPTTMSASGSATRLHRSIPTPTPSATPMGRSTVMGTAAGA